MVSDYVFSVVARPVVTVRSRESWMEIFDMVFGVVNMFSLNKVGAANAGWTSQFRFRGSHHQPGVADLIRSLRHEVAVGTAWLEKSRPSPACVRRYSTEACAGRAVAEWPLLSGVWSLPGNVANLAASRPGDALESEDTVKLLNARKHRHKESSHTRLFKAGAKTARSRVRAV